MAKWARLNVRADDPRVVRQITEDGCGAACARMVLLDRGVDVGLAEIAAWLSEPCDATELAKRLDALSGGRHTWRGGALGDDVPLGPALAALTGAGPVVVQFEVDHRAIGHWLVVDGVEGRRVRVRDPAGLAYDMLLAQLARDATFITVVAER